MTALIENESPKGLRKEHGLAVHIFFQGKAYLLDSGASGRFLSNAKVLQVDLSQVDAAILSHGHFDHGSGYSDFFEWNQKAPLFLREEVKEPCYGKVGPVKKYVGVPKELLSRYADRLRYVKSDLEIAPGVWLISHKTEGLAQRGKKFHMVRQTKAGFLPDDFRHEQTLVLRGGEGLVILNSCSHAGVETILDEVKTAFPGEVLRAFIGGFHLMGLLGIHSMAFKKEEVAALGQRLRRSGVQEIYTCHCTGKPAYRILKEAMGAQLRPFPTGTVLNL